MLQSGKTQMRHGISDDEMQETVAHMIAMSIEVLNLRRIQYEFLRHLALLLSWLMPQEKVDVVQKEKAYSIL